MLPNLLPDLNTPVRELAEPVAVRLREVETVFEALARLRAEGARKRVVYFYVTDADDRLVGVAPMRRLLLAEHSTLVGEIMMHPVFSVKENESFGIAFTLLTKQRLLALFRHRWRGPL